MKSALVCGIERLPKECLSHVLSLTSPQDACRSSAVSTTVRSVADSDDAWRRFLPSDYQQIISRAVDSVDFVSMKELYFRLCGSILIDGGRKSFALEKKSGAKCYTLSARDLVIIWSDHECYWKWISLPESRFAEAAKLKDVCWLEINGRIDSRVLSPNTMYGAYLIFKLADKTYGLNSAFQKASVNVGAYISELEVCLHPEDIIVPAEVRLPYARRDGWMEIEMGEFFNEHGDDGEVCMSLKQVDRMNWKRGLIIEAIQVRPK